MQTNSKTSPSTTIYASAWRYTGPGILIGFMFVIVASAILLRDQSVANAAGTNRKSEPPLEERLNDLIAGHGYAVFQSMRLEIPLHELRGADGELTSYAKSLFMLLARRANSLSLNVTLRTNFSQDVEFVAQIAARMMRDASLRSQQLRIGTEETLPNTATVKESILTVTITMVAVTNGEPE